MSAFAIPSLPGEPFDLVFDVGGNVGEFAARARDRWPAARIVSFEPIPQLAEMNRRAAGGDWQVEQVAVSDETTGLATLYVCENQHTASTMQEPGSTRSREFGLSDSFAPIRVATVRLDAYLPLCAGRERILVKVDVEGHEGAVLAGASDVLTLASTVVVECQQDADIFIDSPSPAEVDAELRRQGLTFAGIADSFKAPSGRVLQFDGVWSRVRVSSG